MYMEIVYVHCNCGELLVVLLKIVLTIFLFSFDFVMYNGVYTQGWRDPWGCHQGSQRHHEEAPCGEGDSHPTYKILWSCRLWYLIATELIGFSCFKLQSLDMCLYLSFLHSWFMLFWVLTFNSSLKFFVEASYIACIPCFNLQQFLLFPWEHYLANKIWLVVLCLIPYFYLTSISLLVV
jgi:hypothetical protein